MMSRALHFLGVPVAVLVLAIAGCGGGKTRLRGEGTRPAPGAFGGERASCSACGTALGADGHCPECSRAPAGCCR